MLWREKIDSTQRTRYVLVQDSLQKVQTEIPTYGSRALQEGQNIKSIQKRLVHKEERCGNDNGRA